MWFNEDINKKGEIMLLLANIFLSFYIFGSIGPVIVIALFIIYSILNF